MVKHIFCVYLDCMLQKLMYFTFEWDNMNLLLICLHEYSMFIECFIMITVYIGRVCT